MKCNMDIWIPRVIRYMLIQALVTVQVKAVDPSLLSTDAAIPVTTSKLSCNNDTFRFVSCVQCYTLISTKRGLGTADNGYFIDVSSKNLPSGSMILADINNKTAVDHICNTMDDEATCLQWKNCCTAASTCCHGRLNDSITGDMCPSHWDGLTCWPATSRGGTVQQPCPEHMQGYKGMVSRRCSEDGSWYVEPGLDTSMSLTNYSSCQALTVESDAYTLSDEVDPAVSAQCRYWDGYIGRRSYTLLSCAYCYKYLFPEDTELFPIGTFLLSQNRTVFSHGSYVVPDVSNQTIIDKICRTLKTETSCVQWLECCGAAEACCDSQLEDASSAVSGGDGSRGCPGTWDGYACWGRVHTAQTVAASCPSYVPHAMPSAKATKTCMGNGTWYRSNHNKEWTNYTACLKFDEFKINIYIKLACNVLSLSALIPSLVIFLSYRTLRNQHRVRLHIHLFLSFILYAIINILWETLVVYDRMNKESNNTRMAGNTPGCKLLYVLTRYSRSTNFVWMFCEGLYLHRLIVKAFQPPKKLLPFYLLGWVFPWIPVAAYSIIRVFIKDESCWVQHIGGYEWIIYIPNLVALTANLAFMIDILRILLTQLQSHPNEPSNYRRALKATFVLVPLFGLQLFLVIYRPPMGSRAGVVYENISSVVVNSQGFFVALIFCLINSEVHANVRRSCIKRGCYKDTGHSRNKEYTMTTQASDIYSNTMESPSPSFRSADGAGKKANEYVALKTLDNENGYVN